MHWHHRVQKFQGFLLFKSIHYLKRRIRIICLADCYDLNMVPCHIISYKRRTCVFSAIQIYSPSTREEYEPFVCISIISTTLMFYKEMHLYWVKVSIWNIVRYHCRVHRFQYLSVQQKNRGPDWQRSLKFFWQETTITLFYTFCYRYKQAKFTLVWENPLNTW